MPEVMKSSLPGALQIDVRMKPAYRNNPMAFLLLLAVAIGFLVFGNAADRVISGLLLWYLSTLLIPLWCESLCRRFGTPIGMAVSLIPVWLPLMILVAMMLSQQHNGNR